MNPFKFWQWLVCFVFFVLQLQLREKCCLVGVAFIIGVEDLASREVENIFGEIVERARLLDPVNTRKWFDKLKVSQLTGGLLRIGCPDNSTVSFLESNCSKSFTRASQQVTGHLVAVEFCVDEQVSTRDSSGGAESELRLHPDYNFENFVVGPSNRLSHASCVAVSQSLGSTYNPLFIYGNSGLGKTHLLHAVCLECMEVIENPRIELLSCEEFVNRFIKAIGDGEISSFQAQFRSLDMLVIDDIQFLREREQSQEEFFHTFNALYNSGKQILLSADCSPMEIPSLEERLISRFNWGLVTRIDPPSFDTRVAIVEKKAQLRDIGITGEIAEYISRKVHANIRELEGALTRIQAVSITTGNEITLELARTALEGHIEPVCKHIGIGEIIEVVTDHFNVRIVDLQSKKRSQSIAEPRQICMYLARNLTKHSFEEIGGHLGGRDHTTVMHACKKIKRTINADPEMNQTIRELTRQISQPMA